MRLSKAQFNRAIEGASDVRTEGPAAVGAQSRLNRSSKIIITALVALVGIGAGWLGGRVLNGRIHPLPAAAPASDSSTSASTGDGSAPADSHASSIRTEGAAARHSQPTPEAEQAPVASEEPPPPEPKPKAAPPKTEKVEKDDGSETPTAEDATKEISRQAFKKMSKDIKRMKRGLANKNENEDPH